MTLETPAENLENVTEEEAEGTVAQPHRLRSVIPIILFSYVGTLIRLSLSLLGNSHAPLAASFWSNFVGCLIMGFVVEQKIQLQQQWVELLLDVLLPHTCLTFSFSQLYVGLTTGLCGSITTFSGVMYYACVALFGPASHQTYPASNYLSVIISLLSSSFVGFVVGRHLSLFILPSPSTTTKKTILFIKDHVNRWVFPTLISISLPLLVILAALLPLDQFTYFIYSLILGPFGALTRYLLSITFNTNPRFPWGTFLANLIGSLIYFGVVAILGYVQISSLLVRQVLIGVIQGYCGCLTTVSTFILELNTIEERKFVAVYLFFTLVPIQLAFLTLGGLFPLLCSPSS